MNQKSKKFYQSCLRLLGYFFLIAVFHPAFAQKAKPKKKMLHPQNKGAHHGGTVIPLEPNTKSPISGGEQTNPQDRIPNIKYPIRGLKETEPIQPNNKKTFKSKSKKIGLAEGDVVLKGNNFQLPKKGLELLTVPEANVALKLSNSQKMGAYVGDRLQRDKTKLKAKSQELFNRTGDINLDAIIERRKNKAREVAATSGDIDASKMIENRKEKSKQLAAYSGDLNNYLENRKEMIQNKSKLLSAYSGDVGNNYLIKRKEFIKDKNAKMSGYSGDIGNNYLVNRKEFIKEKSHKISTYSGDILSKSLEEKKARIKEKTKMMMDYRGDVIIAAKKKGMHPSSIWMGGRIQDSYQDKEKFRKKMLQKARKNREVEEPEYFKAPQTKPKYNSAEYEIWYH